MSIVLATAAPLGLPLRYLSTGLSQPVETDSTVDRVLAAAAKGSSADHRTSPNSTSKERTRCYFSHFSRSWIQGISSRKSRRVSRLRLSLVANALLANAWEEGLKRFLGTRSPGRSLR